MGAIDAIASVSAGNIERKTRDVELPPAAASQFAVPKEDARSTAAAATMMTALMRPTPDGIYVVGSVTMRAPLAIKPIAQAENWSSWGFY